MAQDRFTVAFSKDDEEQKLYEWIIKKSVIMGPSVFVKQTLYEIMVKEENKNN